VDIGLILAAMAEEPTVGAWLGMKLLAWLGVAAGLTFVIFVHELGHFLVAKACGVKCEKFYVGFDFLEFKIPFTNWKVPRSLFKFQYGETEYGLGSLPLGGYVKMLGQDDDPRNAEHEAARIRAAAPNEKVTNEALAHSTAVDPKHPENAPVPAQTTEGKTILLDPRSYPAKPVPARMAIISAGVIMNLIFAVVLAAVAYRLGVDEMPAIVGSTSPGGAAWTVGIEPGSKIIQIGKSGEPYEALRWSDIRTTAVLNSGQDVSLFVRRPNGDEQWYDVRPMKNPETKLPLVGIGVPHKAEVEIFPDRAIQLNPKSDPPLQDFDHILEADGQKVISGEDLMAIFSQKPLGPLNIKVERRDRDKNGKIVEKSSKQPEVFDAVVQPKPMRELGINMKIGRIVAIQATSPAAKAGLQVGDLLVEVNGQPVGDPLSLSQRLTPQSSDAAPVTLVVEQKDQKGEATRRTVNVVPRLPLQSPTQMAMNPTSIEPLGIACDVTFEVAEVAAGSPAAAAELAQGDVVTEFRVVCSSEAEEQALTRVAGPNIIKPMELKAGKKSWADVIYLLQLLPADAKLHLSWKRGDKEMSADLSPRDSETFFSDTRGLTLYVDFEEHAAANWSEAAALGFREAKDQLTQVVTILHRLITGRLSATNLSGPLGIIHVAGSFASQGIAALLLFLTMLSANLAVLNFLPIPALDGGHMLFLSAEAIRGKPVDERLQMRLTIVGVICLLSLMVFATMMDVSRFVKWFS